MVQRGFAEGFAAKGGLTGGSPGRQEGEIESNEHNIPEAKGNAPGGQNERQGAPWILLLRLEDGF